MEQLHTETGNPLELLCFSLFKLILCFPVHDNHKHFMFLEHVVSAHGADMALTREFLGVCLCFSLFVLIPCIPALDNHKCLFWEHIVSDN